jgi:predicted phage terminase large subunit-like protein
VLYGGAVGGGKGLALDTIVPTPGGPRQLCELQRGDLVFDEHGQPTRVLEAHPIRYDLRCYRLTFSDGTEVVADLDHLWFTRTAQERRDGLPGQVRQTPWLHATQYAGHSIEGPDGEMHGIAKIDEVPSVPTRCLTVDSKSQLFCITHRRIPTHNTFAILLIPLRWVHIPGFRALILRRESTQFADIIKKTREIYPLLFPGARFSSNPKNEPPHWLFPSGAKVYLSHCKDEDDKYNYLGLELQIILFDELGNFTVTQFDEIANRLRGVVPGLPSHVRYIRCSANPGGPNAAWIKRRWAPWLDSKYTHPSLKPRHDESGNRLPPAHSGQVLWFRRSEALGVEELVSPGERGATSRTYIRSLLWDNPILMQQDPEYLDRLRNRNDPVRFRQIVHGDWDVQQGRGLFFPRKGWHDGKIVKSPPSPLIAVVRCWDLACTVDGDFAVGAKVGLCERGEIVILNVKRSQGDPATIDRLVVATALEDKRRVRIVIEQEPGSGGKMTIYNFGRSLPEFDISALQVGKETGNKVDRARPLAAQFNLGNVYMIEGPWNDDLINEMHDFPEGTHDDQVDACSGAYYVIGEEEEDEEAIRETINSRLRKRLARSFGKKS